MEEQLAKLIKENRGVLRQLTDITNRLEKLENPKEKVVMEQIKVNIRNIPYPSDEEIANIKVGGTD